MKLYALFFAFLSTVINSQIKFEKGYIITDNGERKDVLIRNVDWSDNPESFTYKFTEEGEKITGQLTNIKEFAVPQHFKYVRYTGNIDISSNNINELSSNQNPVLEKKTIFLNELVDGELKLYQYKEKNIEQFFYAKNNGEITALVYKKYNPDSDTYKIAENTKYISQLKELFAGNTPASFQTNKMTYEKSHLVKAFEEYNGIQTEVKNNRIDFNLSIRPGISSAKLNLDTNSSYFNVDFTNKTTFRIGLEAELVLPFNKNKWSILAEPSYYRYKNESISKDGNYQFETNFDMVDLEIGLRHYMFLNDRSKFFINVGLAANLYLTKDALITYKSLKAGYLNGGSYFNTKSSYFNVGIGYNYNNKFSGELKISTGKELYERGYWNAEISRVSFILGYNIF